MKRLEDIPKKTLFAVPDGYFDRLPVVIQARVTEKVVESARVPFRSYALKFAVPVVALIAVALFFWDDTSPLSAEDILASIDSPQLVAYLEESDLNADELLEAVSLDEDEVEAIQESSIDEMNLTEMDIQVLADEFGTDYN